MSSRTVSVVLTAQVQNYVTNMRAAQAETLRLEQTTKTVTQQFAAHNEALSRVGVGMLAVGATAAAGVALAVKAASDFGAKMAQLQSLSHANAATMQQLSSAAMSVGTAYGFSATQVADAQIELVKAGVTVQQQLGGALAGALTLAAAGQMDVAQATEITTVAMTQFQLSAKEVPHLADLLAAGADKALGSVADLGEGLKNGGLQAHNMGLSINDTVGLLSAFANAGILGAEAGTQMRSMFLRLQNPTSAAKKTLDEYGITINDASGKFVGITRFANELHDKLDGLSQAQRNQALATVFGSHAIVGATVLYQDGGAAAEKAGNSIADWIRNVNASGFASAQAAGKMNSLQGDTQKLAAVFQTDLIKAGSGANDVLRNLTQGATGALTLFGQIPAPLLDVGVGLTAVVAGVGLVGGATLIAVPKVAAFRGALTELGISGRQTAGMIGKGGLLLTAVAAVGAGLANTATMGEASSQQITRSAQVMAGRWKDLNSLFKGDGGFQETGGFKQALGGEQYQAGAAKILDGLTFGISHFSDVYKTNEGAFSAMGQQLAGLTKQNYGAASTSFGDLVTKYKLGADEQKRLLGTMPAYRDALVTLAGKAHIAATDQNLLALATGKGAAGQKALAYAAQTGSAAATRQASTLSTLAGQASSATTNIDALQKAIEGFGSAQLDARSATRAMYQAISDATAAVHKNGAGLDVTTQKGRDNQAALDGIATAADQAASKILKQTGSTKDAAAAMQTGRDAYIKTAVSMGLSRDAAKKLADQLELIPSNITAAVGVTGFDATAAKIAEIKSHMNNLQGTRADVYINAVASGIPASRAAQISKNAGFADGGAITGPGPKGVDSVFAMLAPGEHVLTAREVDRLGGQGGAYAFRQHLDAGQIPRFASGGAVSHHHGANTVAHKPDPGTRKPAKKPDPSAIAAQDAAADAAKRQAATAQAAIDAANKRIRAQKKAAADAAKALSRAQDAAAKISGKGTAAAKHAATLHARDLSKKSKAAAARVTATQKTIDAATKTRDAAKQRQQTAQSAATSLRQGSEDFTSQQRRATPTSPIDPLSYVDQLRQMSRDDNYSSASRSSFDAAANRYESSLVTLSTASAAAAQKLTDLKTASTQMHDSVTSSIAGGYTLAGASTAQRTGNWVTRDGIRYQTTSGGGTASSIAGYYQAGAGSAQQFADALKQLAGRGLSSALLAELAQMGTDAGLPIAQAILSGSDADLQSINSGYGAIQSIASSAGTTVADANYAAQIAAADANAQQITDEIAAQGNALRKVIATAFGLKGYAVGTRNATPGLHWVGEHGPELAGFTGGETVLTAGDSRRWVRAGGAAAAAAPQVTVKTAAAQFPDTITVRDLQGFEMKMQVIADRQIARDAQHEAVLMMGGAA